MASAVATPNPGISHNADDPFGYDAAVDDFLRDIPITESNDRNASSRHAIVTEPSKNIDEEVKVRKQRRPVPKLDESLLLSDRGIPRLRRIVKNKLRFKGKGHEFSDVARLLDTYQLWLDDLYPRAKFRDALTMVEKVGHSKRMQVTRRAWLDETKPRVRVASEEREEEGAADAGMPVTTTAEQNTSEGVDDTIVVPDAERNEEVPLDDELDALLGENEVTEASAKTEKVGKPRGPFEEDDDEDVDDDELDALLAEHPRSGNEAMGSARVENHPNEFADDEEAMAGLGW